MKVTITSMKAPWPQGAGLGSVVELPFDVIPGSLLGKCRPAADDAEAVATYQPPAPPDPRDYSSGIVQLHTMPAAAGPAADADALAAAEALLSESRIEAEELRAMVADLQERLAAAEAAAAKGKKG